MLKGKEDDESSTTKGGPQVFICEMIRISKEERATRTSEVSH